MKVKIACPFILSLFLVTSCGFDRYNAVTDDTADVREGNEYVYGESEDAPPRQAAQTYPSDPKIERKAIELRKKMFEDGTNTIAAQAIQKAKEAAAQTPAPAADSTDQN